MSNLQSTSAPQDPVTPEKPKKKMVEDLGRMELIAVFKLLHWHDLGEGFPNKHLRDATHFVLFISEWQVPTQGCGLVESFINRRRQNGMPFRFGTAARGMSRHS